MGAMHTGLEELEDGAERLAAFYAARARGGAGLIVGGGVAPIPIPGVDGSVSCLVNQAQVPLHRKITSAVHEEGGRILLQVLHRGNWGEHQALDVDRLDADQIADTTKAFANCARLALAAGYDGVEVVGSGTYLINQFLCSRTNKRTDDWGGSAENRMRLCLDIVDAVRAVVPQERILSFRISLMDLIPGGNEWSETVRLAQRLEACGVDIFNSTIGGHQTPIPTVSAMTPRNAFTWMSKALRSEISCPIVATNRINNPEDAEGILARGEADLIALARPMLADPDFANKARSGNTASINTCIACNQSCLDRIFEGEHASCLVNPIACRENECQLRPWTGAKPLAVIGAGPAGLSAAVTAAERGCKVVLFEASSEIGGQINLARQIPGKEEFSETLRYFRTRLDELGVEVRLNCRVDLNALEGFQGLILATGTQARKLEIPGIDRPEVANYADILSGHIQAGERVAIIGAGGIGFDVAEFLTAHGSIDAESFEAEWGIDRTMRSSGGVTERPSLTCGGLRKVIMLQRSSGKFGRGLGKTTGWAKLMVLRRRGTDMIAGVICSHIDATGLHCSVNGVPRVIEVDTVIPCVGQEAVDPLGGVDRTRSGLPVFRIGGARDANALSAEQAILDGFRLTADWE
tara:strand:- start:19964 stop:21874 length:1911 start_codon:yes stop_codon:yes gene_type:complete